VRGVYRRLLGSHADRPRWVLNTASGARWSAPGRCGPRQTPVTATLSQELATTAKRVAPAPHRLASKRCDLLGDAYNTTLPTT
jgi:hypothetical protein